MIKNFLYKWLNIHPTAMSFRETLDLTGLPIITFKQGENKFHFILDTGSDVNIIDSNILDSIEHTMIDCNGTIYGADGIRVKASLCTITLEYKDKEYPFAYHIRDMKMAFDNLKKDHGVTVHGLLGSNFFNKYKYILDFNELIAYSKE